MKLEEYRKKEKFNYRELAEFLGLKKSTTFNICNEKVRCVKLPTAHTIVLKTFSEVDYPDLLWGGC